MKRNQFTFYTSFYDAIREIKTAKRREEVYDLVCNYALNEAEIDMESLNCSQKIALGLIIPVLDSARKKAAGGMKRGDIDKINPEKFGFSISQKEDTSKNNSAIIEKTGNKKEIEKDKEIEIEIETEIEGEGAVLPNAGGGGFDIFWNYFPKKVCKEQARQEFSKVDVSLPVLLTAIRKQQESIQWTRENGRYIPNPATWLAERRWEDELPTVQGGELKASGRLGEAELAAIRRMMAGM